MLVKNALRIIGAGLDDEKIKQEYLAEQNKKKDKFLDTCNNAILILMCVLLACLLVFSLYARFTENAKVGDIPTVKVVETGSMAIKHKDNTYLEGHNLHNQIETFDLVVLHKLPAEEDLQLYDIVVYKTQDYYIIHRIIAIEEPNAQHPNERWFVLRGDANNRSDEFPVRYSQMCSIYRGESIPFVGAFVMFMQSPAGWLCFLLVIFAVVALPIVERKLQQAIEARLAIMGLLGNTQAVAEQPVETVPVVVATVAESDADDEQIVEIDQQDEQDDQQTNIFGNFGERKTFAERLELLSEEKRGWYDHLVYVLMQIPSIRQSRAKYHELYRQGNKPVAKIVLRGKSLYVYLPVNASDYQGIQYGFEDVSHIKAYAKLPSECKVTSRRRLKNLLKLLAKYGDNINIDFVDDDDDDVVDTVATTEVALTEPQQEGSIWSNFGERKTFDQRIELLSEERKGWYNRLVYVLMQIPSIRQSRAKYHELYRQGNKPVAKIVVRGKSLYVYLPLDASNYQGRQFGFEDVSHVKAHGKLTSECKVTSERKLKNILKLFAKYGDKIKIDLPAEGFDFYKLRKKLTLNQKLYRLPKERKARFKQIVKAMEQKEGVTRWQSKNCITFKDGHKPLLKITVKGKSVCVYLAVDPSLYTAPKYGIKDVSHVKAYADYPAMCKVTSDRRLNYVLQIINEKF
ncbi:MAG: hypothetical protein IJX23_04560 [Clostridia bacterium]|nr:hypothetical protein [Clostridia bacterium]